MVKVASLPESPHSLGQSDERPRQRWSAMPSKRASVRCEDSSLRVSWGALWFFWVSFFSTAERHS